MRAGLVDARRGRAVSPLRGTARGAAGLHRRAHAAGPGSAGESLGAGPPDAKRRRGSTTKMLDSCKTIVTGRRPVRGRSAHRRMAMPPGRARWSQCPRSRRPSPAARPKPQAAPPPPAVTVAPVLERDVAEWDEFSGRLEAVDQVEIRPRVSGYIKRLTFTEGREVRKGEVLFEIDPRPYQADLDRAQAQLEQARTAADLAAARGGPRREAGERRRPSRARSSTAGPAPRPTASPPCGRRRPRSRPRASTSAGPRCARPSPDG